MQASFFKKAIEDMAASSLRCVAIAYRTYDMDKVPVDEQQLTQWALPQDDLVLLAIIGLKVCLAIKILQLNSQCDLNSTWVMIKPSLNFTYSLF